MRLLSPWHGCGTSPRLVNFITGWAEDSRLARVLSPELVPPDPVQVRTTPKRSAPYHLGSQFDRGRGVNNNRSHTSSEVRNLARCQPSDHGVYPIAFWRRFNQARKGSAVPMPSGFTTATAVTRSPGPPLATRRSAGSDGRSAPQG